MRDKRLNRKGKLTMAILKKMLYQQSQPILNMLEMSPQASQICTENTNVEDAVAELKIAKLYYDLIQFIAHGLPVREAIWWASLCLHQRHTSWSKLQNQAIIAAQDWVQMPQEDMRRRCEHIANKLTLKCAPSWLVQAVFWNGDGSIVEQSLPSVLPAPTLYAKAVAGAINLAAAIPEWNEIDDYHKFVIASGENIAQGGNGHI